MWMIYTTVAEDANADRAGLALEYFIVQPVLKEPELAVKLPGTEPPDG